MPFELFVALRYLRSRRKQVMISVITMIAVGAVSVGVAALILVMALMTGFREDLQSRILSGTAHLNVVRKDNLPLRDYPALIDRIRGVPGVRSAVPALYETVLLQGQADVAGAILKGVDPGIDGGLAEVASTTVEGDANSLKRDPSARFEGIVVGRDLASEVGLNVGQIATVITTGPQLIDGTIIPRSLDFRVVGIFESGLYDYDSRWAYISVDAARKLEATNEVVRVVQIQVDDIYAVKAIGAEVQAMAGPECEIKDWQQLNEPLYAALALERLGFLVVLVVVVTIAALNIITMLTMMVMEKTSDIGILKSMGATNAMVMRIFMAQGLAIGVVGAAVGTALGAGLVWYFNAYKIISLPADVYSISHITFRMRPADVATVIVATVVISFLSTIYPARSAAKLNPVEALRYE